MKPTEGPSTKGPGSEVDAAPSPPPKLHPEVLAAQTRDILTVLLVFRFVNALCVRTFFQPDEYFQALDPAWSIAFGDQSGAWLTWEWQHQLRSSLHPALFGAAYIIADKIMAVFELFLPFRAMILVALPKVIQSAFSALSDFYTWKLAEKIYGRGSNIAWSAFWVTIFNPWLWYCSTRTFSNSLETTLTVVALYHWPWEILGDAGENKQKLFQQKSSVNSLRLSLISAAVAVVLRPTNILIWLAVLTLALTRLTLDGTSPLRRQSLLVLVREIVICGLSTLAISVVSDRLYFGFWAFPPYKWLHFNISQSLAVFYGHMPWHYYLLQGIPLLTTTFLPFTLLGIFKSMSPSSPSSMLQSNTLKTLAFTVITTVGALSMVSHKEVRFIYPLLPVLHVLAAPFLSSFFIEPPPPASKPEAAPSQPTVLRHKYFLANIICINLLLATYLSAFHQPAPISAVNFLRDEFERLHPDRLDLHPASPAASDPDPLFVFFLTPCHSTPWRSHLVYPRLRARALTCEPPLHTAPGGPERAAYRDEADRFYDDPAGFLHRELWPVPPPSSDGAVVPLLEEIPRFVVGFEGVEEVLRKELASQADRGVNLTRRWSAFNGLFNEDWRRRGRLVVWDTGIGPQWKPRERLAVLVDRKKAPES